MNVQEWTLEFQLGQCVKMGVFGPKLVYKGFEKDLSANTEGDSFSSFTLYGDVVCYDPQTDYGEKKSVILKMLEKRESKPFLALEFQNEISLYTRILPYFAEMEGSVRDLLPRYYYSSCSTCESQNFTVAIFENLKQDGYRLSEQNLFLDFQHLALMMTRLGKFHAFSYYAKQTDPKHFHRLVKSCMTESHWTQTTEMVHTIVQGYWSGIKPLQSDPEYRDRLSSVLEFINNPQKFIRDVFTEYDESVAVVCHGDFLRNNVLFKYDDEVTGAPVDAKLIDFGSLRYSSPIVDLALVLYFNTSQEMRDKHWDNLLSVYYESLCSTFPEAHLRNIPSFQRLKQEFRGKSFYSYIIATHFLPVMLCIQHNVTLVYGDKINLDHYDFLKDYCPTTLSAILKDMINRGFV